MKREKGQVSLELAFGLICLMVLFWGSFNIFLWLNQQMINRQEDYAATRQKIADTWTQTAYTLSGEEITWPYPYLRHGTEPKPVDESDTKRYPKLDVFK